MRALEQALLIAGLTLFFVAIWRIGSPEMAAGWAFACIWVNLYRIRGK